MANENPYLALAQQDREAKLRESMQNSVDKQPDAEVKIQGLAKNYGMPPEAVRMDTPTVENRAKFDAIDYTALARENPATSNFLSDRNNAAIAHDDTGNLSAFETALGTLKDIGGAFVSGITQFNEGFYGTAQAVTESTSDLVTRPAAQLFGFDDPLKPVSDTFSRYRKESQAYTKSLLPQTQNVYAQGAYSGLQSLAQYSIALPAAFMAAPEVAAAFITSLLSGSVGGQSYGQARDKGLDVPQSLTYATSQAAIEFATEKLPVGKLIGDVATGTPFLKALVKNMALEIPGEQIATVLQDLNDWAVLNPEKPFSVYLAERPNAALQTAIATVVGSGGATVTTYGANAAMERVTRRERQAQQAEANAAALTRLNDIALASNLRKRDPDAFTTFINQATENAPVQNVYIDARTLGDVLSQSGVPLDQVIAAVPSLAEQMVESGAFNGDVRIPIGEFGSGIAGTDLAPALIPHLKTDPNGMSQFEARNFMQSQAQDFQSEVEKTLTERQDDDAFKQSLEVVKADVAQQLAQTGRFTKDVNEAYATLVSNFYAVQAAKLGITPEQFAQQYPVKIQAISTDGTELNQDARAAPTFYSALNSAVEGMQQGKATPEQWRGILDNLTQKGIKNEELEWSGVREWLAEQKGPITREQVMDYLRANELRVQDVVKEQPMATYAVVTMETGDFDGHIDELANGEFRLTNSTGGFTGTFDSLDEAHDFLRDEGREANFLEVDPGTDRTKFQQYVLPGGENYRELLITLPVDKDENVARLNEISQRLHGKDYTSLIGDNPETAKLRLAVKREYKKIYGENGRDAEERSLFRSGHFDEPNVLAHIRFNERTDADGKRVLFIEEIQSDWHQKGRDKGYAKTLTEDEKTRRSELIGERNKLIDERRAVARQPGNEGFDTFTAFAQRIDALQAQIDELNGDTISSGAVPDAPFKTTWPELAFKRALRWAVDNGFDRVAWTTGEQQAERYDLSKQISRITYNAPGSRMAEKYGTVLKAYDKKGDEVINKEVPPEELADFIGKDAAKKILEGQPNKDGKQELSGVDLKVGGEGMKGFYDKILPNAVNKLVKKWGGKVGQTKLPRQDSVTADEGFPYSIVDSAGVVHNRFRTRIAAESELAELNANTGFRDYKLKTDNELLATLGPTVHSVDITPDMRRAVSQGLPLFQTRRGAYNPGERMITLLKDADLSTFLHEAGHFFLEVQADLASRENAPPELKQDMDAILKWFGVPDLQTWLGYDLEQQRDHHEKFARAFEAYLFEGKAPNLELRQIFQRFRAWLLQIYRQMRNLNVEVSDELRAVFDRMLASTEQIMYAEQTRQFAPLFGSAKDAGMTPDEWEAYQALGQEATQDAVNNLENRSLRDMKWLSNAKARIIKALQKDARAKRRAVEREVTAEVMNEPVNRAKSFLRRGLLSEGVTLPEGVETHRLALPALKEMYGDGQDALWRQLGSGKYGMTAEEGIHPDIVAEWFGFSSGDKLVQKLLAAENPRDKIQGMTDQRMLERYGDLASPEALSRAADAAIHNDARTRFVATELNALQKATGKQKILASAAKEFAAKMIDRLKIRNLRPAQYTSAETRAGREASALQAKGDLTGAAIQKRNQLIQNYAARAAFEAQDAIEKGLAYLAKFGRERSRASIDPSYIEQIDALLERYDLKSSTTLKAIEKRKSLRAWVEAQREMGLEPVISDELIDDANRKSYKEMTVEEFRGLIDAVRNIEHLGRLKKKLLTIQYKREFSEFSNTAAQTIRENATKKAKDKIESNTWLDRAGSAVNGFFAEHRKLASLIRQMGGFKEGGFLWETFIRPMNDAGNKEAVMRDEAAQELHAIFAPLLKKYKIKKKMFIEGVGSLSLEGRLAIALNWGNETNRLRVLEGDKWSQEQVDSILKTLTPDQWEFVQNVWDYIDKFWPQVAAKEKRVTGVEPQKVEASPFTVKVGSVTLDMRGGYYPIKYDPRRSSKSEADTMAEYVKQTMQGLYSRATTRRGHTKARVDSVDRPVEKTLDVVFQHVDQVIHDLSWHEYLIDANRLLRSHAVDAAIRDHYGPEVLRTMKNALDDIAAGETPAKDSTDAAINYIRKGVSIAGLGWNLTTAFLQPLGLTQSMVRIGPKWVARGLSRWLGDAARMENTAKWIYEQSDFMRLRGKTMQREINEIRNTIKTNKSDTANAIENSFFYLITKMQLVADIPTWLGAYEKAMEENTDEKRAVALADQAVIDAQGSGQTKDLAQVQRGGPKMKLFTSFYSFFSTTHNLLMESVGKAKLRGATPASIGLLTADALLLITIPAVMAELLRSALRGDDLDDDEKLLKRLGKAQLSYLAGSMIWLRELGSAIGDYGYNAPPTFRVFQAIGDIYKQSAQGDADEAFFKALNTAGGILFHYPAGQVQRTVQGIMALADGKDVSPLAPLVGVPPKK